MTMVGDANDLRHRNGKLNDDIYKVLLINILERPCLKDIIPGINAHLIA